MKLINSRFRVNDVIYEGEIEESYIVKDIQEKDKIKYLNIYNGENNKRVIDYFTEEFSTLVNIKHKNLVMLDEFGIIESINLKKSGSLTNFYMLNEYIKAPRLIDLKDKISLEDCLKIIVDLMSVIDFIHFRGFSYKHLSPTNVFISDNCEVKLRDLASITRDFIYSQHDDLTELFLAPELFADRQEVNKFVDYYSIGMIMKYLLFKGLNIEEVSKNSFRNEFKLTDNQKVFLLNTITNLTHKDQTFRSTTLKNHIQGILTIFILDYNYDLVKERDHLILNTKIIGRDKEINTFIGIDNSLSNGVKKFNGAIISGRPGSGKTKLLREIAFRYCLLGRSVFHIKGREDLISGGLNIATLLKASFKNAPNDILNKYNDDFNEVLSKDANDEFKYDALRSKTSQEKHMIFNRLTNYFADLSKDGTIYILIDDVYAANDDFISFLNYMMFKLENNKVFLIITTVDPVLVNNNTIKLNLKLMSKSDSVLHIELDNLSEGDTGKFVKRILGMNYIPKDFSSFIYKESLGNPNYIYFIIKDIYNRGHLYMSERGVWDTKEKDYDKIIISIDENHVINSQLESLNKDEYKVLELISLSKDMVTKDILMEMIDIEGENLNSIIKSLIESKIINDKIKDNTEIISVYSTELKKTVYSRLDCLGKQRLHKKVASLIIRLYKDNFEFIMEELIYHLKNSDQNDYALELVLEEANNQTNKYNSYSISLWEHAYYLVKNTDNDEILKILDTLISIYNMQGFTDLTGDYLTKMHRIAMDKNNLEYLIMAKHHQIEIYFISNQLDIAESLIAEIEEIVNNHEELYKGKILLLINKTKHALNTSRFEGIDQYLLEAIKISKENNILKYLGAIYNLYGIYYYMIGKTEEAAECFNKSIKYFELYGNTVEGIKPINNMGNIYSNIYGEDDEALVYYQKGYEIALKYEFAKASGVFTSNIGGIYYQNFQLDKAQYYYETSRNIGNDIGEYRTIILSNLSLGMIYLRLNKYEKAKDIYIFIEEVNNKEPFLDSEILTGYYTFMGMYNFYFGKFEEALKFFELLREITKEYSNRENAWAEANIIIIKALRYSDYNREEMENIINKYQLTKMNNIVLETLLVFAMLALDYEDYDFAKKILNIYSKNEYGESESLIVLRDIIDISVDTTVEKLLAAENHENKQVFKDYFLYYHVMLAEQWAKLKNYNRAISHSFKALDNLLKRMESIRDKELRYSATLKNNGDELKAQLARYIKLEFGKDINYITLDEAYRQGLRYNDLNRILDQLTLDKYRQIKNIDNNYEYINSLETLIDKFTDDYQRNMDMVLNYIGYVTLANKGYILLYDEENDGHVIISSLNNDSSCTLKKNLLSQSNRSTVGIVVNKNLKNMDSSKYVEFLPESAVGVICVPLFKNKRNEAGSERRKMGTRAFIQGETQLRRQSKVYIYLETDSFLNKFEYDKLLLIKNLANLIHLNAENRYFKSIAVTDKLTGVLTRKHFELEIEDLIDQYSQYNGSFSLLMVDLDNFKGINDTYGHLTGDEVLSVIGSTLKESVRSTDLVARYGGEEFVIILFDTNIKEGFDIADKIRKNIMNIKIPGVERQISVSIGLAQYPEHGQSKKNLIGKADQALYNAKEIRGKNTLVVWNIDMGEGSNNRDKLAGILTGNTNKDNMNISNVINTVALIEKDLDENKKIYEFTKRVLEILEAQYATFIKYQQGKENIIKTRVRNVKDWVKTPKLNDDIIDKVVANKKGEFLVDWDNVELIDPITEEPQWQSVLVLPLIKNNVVLGVIYLSVPIKEKEFTFEDFNLGSLLSNIFTAALSQN
ncbi:MAG: diguanylate cyclase [Tissierella sp.]|nr:diguanylate cyclase [Tissierella sp.]